MLSFGGSVLPRNIVEVQLGFPDWRVFLNQTDQRVTFIQVGFEMHSTKRIDRPHLTLVDDTTWIFVPWKPHVFKSLSFCNHSVFPIYLLVCNLQEWQAIDVTYIAVQGRRLQIPLFGLSEALSGTRVCAQTPAGKAGVDVDVVGYGPWLVGVAESACCFFILFGGWGV